jgi:hypothetical protein
MPNASGWSQAIGETHQPAGNACEESADQERPHLGLRHVDAHAARHHFVLADDQERAAQIGSPDPGHEKPRQQQQAYRQHGITLIGVDHPPEQSHRLDQKSGDAMRDRLGELEEILEDKLRRERRDSKIQSAQA